jgi:hypothetical protein
MCLCCVQANGRGGHLDVRWMAPPIVRNYRYLRLEYPDTNTPFHNAARSDSQGLDKVGTEGG